MSKETYNLRIDPEARELYERLRTALAPYGVTLRWADYVRMGLDLSAQHYQRLLEQLSRGAIDGA